MERTIDRHFPPQNSFPFRDVDTAHTFLQYYNISYSFMIDIMWGALNSMRSWLNDLIIENEWVKETSSSCSFYLERVASSVEMSGSGDRRLLLAPDVNVDSWTTGSESDVSDGESCIRGNEPRISVRCGNQMWRRFLFIDVLLYTAGYEQERERGWMAGSYCAAWL